MKVELKISKPEQKALLFNILAQSNYKDWTSIIKLSKISELLKKGHKDLGEGKGFEFSKDECVIADIELASFAKKAFEDFIKDKGIPGGAAEGVKELGISLGLAE